MARIRSVKPEWFTEDAVCRLPASARLLYLAIKCHADDQTGVFRARSSLVKSQGLIEDRESYSEIAEYLDQMRAERMIVLFRHGGVLYGQVVDWKTIERIDHPGKMTWPEPPITLTHETSLVLRRRETEVGGDFEFVEPVRGMTCPDFADRPRDPRESLATVSRLSEERGARSEERGGGGGADLVPAQETQPEKRGGVSVVGTPPTETPQIDRHPSVPLSLAFSLYRSVHQHNPELKPPKSVSEDERFRAESLLRLHPLDRLTWTAEWACGHQFWRSKVTTLAKFARNIRELIAESAGDWATELQHRERGLSDFGT